MDGGLSGDNASMNDNLIDIDTDWTHTDTDEYYREYKGLELFIKVKRDYSRLYIWHPRAPLEEWFDGRIRGDYKDEVDAVQKHLEAKADMWAEMIARGYLDMRADDPKRYLMIREIRNERRNV